ncbi:preprotein translocase subunit YajC [Sphingomonas sp. Root710]|uniref:preprotein translocase subunit YajC n=1 Tax=Sphingomonas sp. Root710 TaxID=1736594 RepID=UPI0006FA11CD|nr:preprotein translocase subunit YajC [Sphingomonas sp. Root710]KRB81210.1 preprotein translocase subunit YajC [Sphingomonas sp. Root710]
MFASPAYAQAAGAAPVSGGAAAFMQFAPLIFIFVIFYFLMIRPQQKKMKEHRLAVDAVQKNDQIVTAGGLIAKVIKVDANEVEAEIAPNVRVKIVKATIAEVRSAGSGKPAND